jgi:hypothetical protein
MYLSENLAINKNMINYIGIGIYAKDIKATSSNEFRLNKGDEVAYVQWTHNNESRYMHWPKNHEYYDHIKNFLDNGYYYKTSSHST